MSKKRKIRKTKSGALFDPAAFFDTAGKGRTISTHRKKDIVFSQGDAKKSKKKMSKKMTGSSSM